MAEVDPETETALPGNTTTCIGSMWMEDLMGSTVETGQERQTAGSGAPSLLPQNGDGDTYCHEGIRGTGRGPGDR